MNNELETRNVNILEWSAAISAGARGAFTPNAPIESKLQIVDSLEWPATEYDPEALDADDIAAATRAMDDEHASYDSLRKELGLD